MRGIQGKVECPRCHKVWIVSQGESEIDCNCHTYCEDGDKPSDCTLTASSLDHEVSWPYGMETGSSAYTDDPTHIQYYCSTHSRYGYKVPISIPVDWNTLLSRRLKKKWRMVNTV